MTNKITIDKALLEQAMRAIFPVMGYGLPGTKDTQQYALQQVYAGLTAALAEPAVEPVCYQYQRIDGEWYPFMHEKHRADTVADGSWPIRALYTSPPPPAEPAVEPVKFLANGTRFKMAFFHNEDSEGQVAEGMYVTCFEGFEDELDGRWVALVAAEDDCHMKLKASPQPPAEHSCKWPTCQTEAYQQDLADQLARELIGTPPVQEPVAWRFRKNGHWAFRSDNVNGLVCEPLFAMQVPESVYKRALDEWLDKTEWVQKTAQTHELGMHRADVLRRRIEAKVRQKAGL